MSAGYRLMGVVNVTPDSFSDGGLFLDPGAAIAHGLELVEQGAQILDVGGESTRPGAEPVGVDVELRRVVSVIEALSRRASTTQISIDTSKAAVAQAAVSAGATLVNDVSALRADPEMVGVVAASGADCCLMHMLGSPRTMQRGVDGSSYTDVVDEVKSFLEGRLAFAVDAGIPEQRILLDPGIGFGKTVEHNLALLRRLEEIVALGPPVVIGTSRKSFLGGAPADRLPGTIATNVMALERGASVFRVHDVAPVAAALAVASATLSGKWTASPTTS
jgi:dihydropteroate synthase